MSPWLFIVYIDVVMKEGKEFGFNCKGGSGGPCLCCSCFTWMYLDCARGLAYPPRL